MIKLKAIYPILSTTLPSTMPEAVRQHVSITTEEFMVNNQSFAWGDYVVVDIDNQVSGMTLAHIKTIADNSRVIFDKFKYIDGLKFAMGIMDDISRYATMCSRVPALHQRIGGNSGDSLTLCEEVRKIITLDNNQVPYVMDFHVVRDILAKLKYHLGVNEHEQLTLSPYDTTANCDPA